MGKEKYRGSLEQDWKLLEPITIDDETDTKPASWVDNIMQVDVGDRKPADWIDHKRIPDHTMSRPAKWDEAEDGVWMPTKPNPEYKGEWRPRMVRNPEYLGEWKKRKIPNPKYKPDAELYRYDDIAYIALDFFSVLGGTQFDDFLICDTEAEADEAVKHWESWEEQLKAEFFQKRKNMPLVQQMWDDKSEVEDYDEDDEEVPIMPRKPMRPEL
jgi:calreticulin